MSQLMLLRDNFSSDEEFRKFAFEAVTELSRDLRNLDIEVSVRAGALNTRRRNPTDWNPLHIGCE
jgi:hypothetical protein